LKVKIAFARTEMMFSKGRQHGVSGALIERFGDRGAGVRMALRAMRRGMPHTCAYGADLAGDGLRSEANAA
jgi:hypothetical protein